jgi:hypothetical protein
VGAVSPVALIINAEHRITWTGKSIDQSPLLWRVREAESLPKKALSAF